MTSRREFLSLGAALGAAFPGVVATREAHRHGRILMETDERWQVQGFPVLNPHLLHVEFDADVMACTFLSRERQYGSGQPWQWILPGWEAEDASEVWEQASSVMEAGASHGAWYLYVVRVDCPSFTRYHVGALPERGLTSADMRWLVPTSIAFAE